MTEESFMKATWHGHVMAESDQTIGLDGYQYFPPASVRMEFLQAAPKIGADQGLTPAILAIQTPLT
jgi:uncharacterized protein (DUF427 family)